MVIIIPMVPVPKGRPRMTRNGIAYTPTKTREAEKFIRTFLTGYPMFADVPLAVTIDLFFLRPKSAKKRLYPPGDTDNYAKLVLDSANGLLYPDDRCITRLLARKEYGDPARVEITIEEVLCHV